MRELRNNMLSKLLFDLDNTLLDFDAYKAKKEEALQAYKDQKGWAKKALVNIAKAGFFSSDRTIAQYNEDIWHL